MEDPLFTGPFEENTDTDEESMEDLYYYDMFLDDCALFMDGLLSAEDAQKMYQCGEISKLQLIDYQNFKQNESQQQSNQDTNPWIVALITIIIIMICLCAIFGG